MEDRAASRTAVMVAAYRASATEAYPHLCNDPWAGPLAGAEGEALCRALDRVQRDMDVWIAVRTAFLDRCVTRSVPPEGDVQQVVVLGAGLDTRAARLAREGVRFFEVDQPASQADKRVRLATVPGYPTEAATYVACDFERDDFLERLAAEGFDAAAPAVVLWEGVTPYLTEQAVRATLGRIARGCHPRTVVAFDHLGKRMAEGAVRHAEDAETRDMVHGLGEPLRWGTNHVVPLLYEEGFRKVRVTTFDEAALNMTGTYDRERKWRFQFLAVASVEAAELGA